MVKHPTIWGLFFFHCLQLSAQQSCFARVELDTRSVYVQQPFKVTFTVLTATWYTAPLDFENLQIPNAFIIPFDQTRPGMFTVNGKQYAGLTFYYIVFPYKSGNFTLPPIKIRATTPPEGSSESRKITIATPAQHYLVKPVPGDFDGDWMVAKNVVISEHWNKPLHNLKVGDMIERRIVESASGTLPQFIPEIRTDSLSWSSIYAQDPDLRDTRNEYDANGVRSQNYTYLLEKEGDYEIPAAVVKWWNPYSHKMFQRSTGTTKIHVAPNPNLGILATIKDSLKAKQAPTSLPTTTKASRQVFGMPWYWFALLVLGAAALIYVLTKIFVRLYRFFHQLYEGYRQSEYYWFRKFEKSAPRFPAILRSLYQWWDRFNPPGKRSSLMQDAVENQEDPVASQLHRLYEDAYGKNDPNATVDPSFDKNISRYRARAFDRSSEDKTLDNHQQPFGK